MYTRAVIVFNTHAAKTHFSRLLERVEHGEEIVIARAGVPVARLVPFAPANAERTGGTWRGQVRIDDNFDAPLPHDIANAFGEDGA